MRRSERRNNLQICPHRDSNTGGSDLWSNTLPLDHEGAPVNIKKVIYNLNGQYRVDHISGIVMLIMSKPQWKQRFLYISVYRNCRVIRLSVLFSLVMYIAVGVMAGVAVVAIISVVVLAMYCRRHHQKDPLKSEPKHSVDQPKETPGCTSSAPTSNPAYGVNCDFLNNYEMPENVNSQSLEPHVYPPLVPPRPSNQEDSRHSGTYEEIKDTINKGSAVQGCEIRSDQVSLPENEYDLYGSPEYEHLKTDINNGEIVRNNDIVLDNVTSDPELQGKNQKRDPGQTATYLDLLQK